MANTKPQAHYSVVIFPFASQPQTPVKPGLSRTFDHPYLLLALTSLFWAGNTIIGRGVADLVPPATLTWVRWNLALIVVLPFALPHLKRDWAAIKANFVLITILALLGVAGYNLVAYLALHYTQAINSLLLQSVAPLFVGLWSFVLFRDRLTLVQATGVLISMTGALVIICRGDAGVLARLAFNIGDIMILIALVFYALYTALLRRRPTMHPVSFLTAMIMASAAISTPLIALELATGHVAVLNAGTLGAFAYLAIFPSILAYFCLNRGIELIGANRAAPFIHLMPVFGSVMAMLFLGERPQLFHGLGYALVLVGIFIAARR
jgi:drug/metabolite transporter (DMT)-like permease